jgi:phosphatidylinositol glycan class B
VFFLLLALRILNALTLRTFFQPDEYFQSLEPAWQIAFGQDSGAWVTWVKCSPFLLRLAPDIFLGVPFGPCLNRLQNLTIPAGVESPVAVFTAPSPIRGHLSGGGDIGQRL